MAEASQLEAVYSLWDLCKVCTSLRSRSADAEQRPTERGAILQRTCALKLDETWVCENFREHSSEQRLEEDWLSFFQASRDLRQTLHYVSIWTTIIIDHFMNLAKPKYIFYLPGALPMAGVGVQPWYFFPTAKEQHFTAVEKQKYSTVILSFVCIVRLRCLVLSFLNSRWRYMNTEVVKTNAVRPFRASSQRSKGKAGHLIRPLNLYHH